MSRWLLVAWLAVLSQGAIAAKHAVILLYHRVADTGPASTRVSPERFAAHLDLLHDRNYQVLALEDLLAGVYGDGALPERAVALTFDDAYRSVGEMAYPMLRERGLPFTVFVATDVIDQGARAFLDWPTLQKMAQDELVTFGPHSKSHAHLESLGRSAGPNAAAGSREQEIDGSLARLHEQLGDAVLDVFAYPFGEYSLATEAVLAERGLYGLAQQSGPVGPTTPRTRIPRFPLYSGGDSDARLASAIATLPLPVVGEDAAEVFFESASSVPREWYLQFVDGAYYRDRVRCYAASGDALEQRWEGDALRVVLPAMLPGRNKVNCTAPSKTGDAYHWYSRLWLIADDGGR